MYRPANFSFLSGIKWFMMKTDRWGSQASRSLQTLILLGQYCWLNFVLALLIPALAMQQAAWEDLVGNPPSAHDSTVSRSGALTGAGCPPLVFYSAPLQSWSDSIRFKNRKRTMMFRILRAFKNFFQLVRMIDVQLAVTSQTRALISTYQAFTSTVQLQTLLQHCSTPQCTSTVPKFNFSVLYSWRMTRHCNRIGGGFRSPVHFLWSCALCVSCSLVSTTWTRTYITYLLPWHGLRHFD